MTTPTVPLLRDELDQERRHTADAYRRLNAVAALHRADGGTGRMCVGCGRAWPCPTTLAAGGES